MGNAEAVSLSGAAVSERVSGSPSIERAGAVLMSGLIADLAEWLGCSWAVALGCLDRGLVPICVCRTQPAPSPGPGTVEWGEPAEVVVPITVRDDIRGVLAFGPKKGACAYTAADQALIQEAATQVSNLLGSERLVRLVAPSVADRRRNGLDLRTVIQGLDYYGECQPAGGAGRDFFDFVPLGKRALAVSLGDVSGTGISSAIMRSGLQAFLRGLIADRRGDVPSVVQELNRTIYEVSPDDFYATLFYARIDPLRWQLQYASAGHEPALLIRREATRAHRLERTGTVLGLSGRTAYGQRTVVLEPGDLLVAFTDGVAGVIDAGGRELCDAGVLGVVRRHPDARASEIAGQILEEVSRLTDRSGQAADRTVVVVRFTGALGNGAGEAHAAEPAAA